MVRYIAPHSDFETSVRRAIVLAFCTIALFWAGRTLSRSIAVVGFETVEAELLSLEKYSARALANMLTEEAALNFDSCDTRAQRALLLAEIPLVELSLKNGAASEFDSHMHALEVRTQQILRCAPRDAFAWLVAFNLRIIHGQLDDRTFQFLDMSFDNSPNEAWIAIRRSLAAMPFADRAPSIIRVKVAIDFGLLIRNGYFEEAARSYLAASDPMRATLTIELEKTTQVQQKRMLYALENLPQSNRSPRTN